MASPVRRQGEDWLLTVHVQPGAGQTGLAGLHGEALKLRLRAPPVDGKANDELCRFIAVLFAVKRQEVRLLSGESSRHKKIAVKCVGELPAAITTILQGSVT